MATHSAEDPQSQLGPQLKVCGINSLDYTLEYGHVVLVFPWFILFNSAIAVKSSNGRISLFLWLVFHYVPLSLATH